MHGHRFEPINGRCVGCDAREGDIAERSAKVNRAVLEPEFPMCPAFYHEMEAEGWGRLLYVITPDERLLVFCGGALIFHAAQVAMFGLRDTIEAGVRYLREHGRSTAAPR